MAVFNNPYAFKPTNKVDVFPPSVTVPNLAMSLQEILTRYTQGTLPNSNSFMQELPYNNGKLSPLARKGVGLEDYSSIMNQSIQDVNLSAERDKLIAAQQESATAAIKDESQRSSVANEQNESK